MSDTITTDGARPVVKLTKARKPRSSSVIVKRQAKTRDDPTRQSKIWQSLIAFIVVNHLYLSGEVMTHETRSAKALAAFNFEVSAFMEKRSKFYAPITEYMRGDFTELQLRSITKKQLLTGRQIVLKGLAVRRDITAAIALVRLPLELISKIL